MKGCFDAVNEGKNESGLPWSTSLEKHHLLIRRQKNLVMPN